MCWIAAYRRSISEVTCHWVRSCLLIPQNRIFFHVRCWEACWGLPPRVWWRSVADAGDQVSLPSFHLQVRKTNHERVREGEPTFFYLFAGVAKCQASAEKARFVASLMSCYFRKCIAEQALSIPKVEITVTFVSFFLLKKKCRLPTLPFPENEWVSPPPRQTSRDYCQGRRCVLGNQSRTQRGGTVTYYAMAKMTSSVIITVTLVRMCVRWGW